MRPGHVCFSEPPNVFVEQSLFWGTLLAFWVLFAGLHSSLLGGIHGSFKVASTFGKKEAQGRCASGDV